jgi:hypothetical protein
MIKTNVENIGKWSNIEIEVQCDSCYIEKKLKYKLYTSYGYSDGEYLCKKCKLKKNNLEKFGVENVFQLESVKEKSRKRNLEKFGVEFVSQSNDIKAKIKKSISKLDKNEINQKRNETNLKKYGVNNVSQIEIIKEKKKETTFKNIGENYIFNSKDFRESIRLSNLEKFGIEHFFQTDDFKTKSKKTNLKKYQFDNASKSDIIKEKIKESLRITFNGKILNGDDNITQISNDFKFYNILCENCKTEFTISRILFYKRRETNTEICTICNTIDKHQSGKEIKLFNFIKSIYQDEIIQNFKIERQEIDIYLPKINLGFEFNGVYWHSDIFKEKDFHSNKSKFFEKKGIHIFHIWEDDFDEKEEIIKSQIQNIIGKSQKIPARKCEVKEINDINLIKEFLNQNHIQGCSNSKIKIGLFFNSELVSLMTFDKFEGRIKMKEDEWNLNRFCNKSGLSVIGGASKLLSFFTKKYNPNRIISYSDKDWSKGELYQKLGFKKIHETIPDYKYLVNFKRIHKSNFKKSITGISESNLDLPKIWDCGKIKWELKEN